jgi:hypothetical protein
MKIPPLLYCAATDEAGVSLPTGQAQQPVFDRSSNLLTRLSVFSEPHAFASVLLRIIRANKKGENTMAETPA